MTNNFRFYNHLKTFILNKYNKTLLSHNKYFMSHPSTDIYIVQISSSMEHYIDQFNLKLYDLFSHFNFLSVQFCCCLFFKIYKKQEVKKSLCILFRGSVNIKLKADVSNGLFEIKTVIVKILPLKITLK